MTQPFGYPRAGSSGDPELAREVEGLLTLAVKTGIPVWKLGPSLVRGFASFFRKVPKRFLDKGQIPLLYALLGSGTPPLKMSKKDAAYKTKAVGQQACGNCSSAYKQVVTGDTICSQVEGKIKPSHWCRLWNTDRN